MDTRQAAPTLIAHWKDKETFYVDFRPLIHGRSIDSVVAITSEPSGPTVTNQAPLAADTVVPLPDGGTLTIPAAQGISFRLAGLAKGQLYTLTAVVQLDDEAQSEKGVDLPLQT